MKKIEDKFYNNGKVYEGQLILCSKCGVPSTFTEWLDKPGGYLEKEVCDNCGYTMLAGNNSNINTHNRCHYEKKCACGNKVFLLAQPDNHPEYRADVGILCSKCGKEIWFSLPVN